MVNVHVVVDMEQGESKPYFRFQLGTLRLFIIWPIAVKRWKPVWLSRKGSYRSDLQSFAFTPTYHQKRASNHSMSRIRRFSWRESPYLTEILYLILTENSFQYYGSKYLQTHGTAMGKKIAVAFAKIYMARIENQILRQSCTEPIEPMFWKRYIDDWCVFSTGNV